MIYFIQCDIAQGESQFVKIGYCKGDPRKRLEHLQVGCPYPLVLIGQLEGGEKEEAELHQKYRAYRVRGEWFNLPHRIISHLYFKSMKAAGKITDKQLRAIDQNNLGIRRRRRPKINAPYPTAPAS